MTLATSLVEVRTVTSNQPRSNFDEQKIEEAAELIVAAEGIINPLIVSRTGINSFQVVNGHFEYYAAARARELDLEIGEAIAAYIIEERNEAILREQVSIFRPSLTPQAPKSSPNNDTPSAYPSNLEIRFTNFESRTENRQNELKTEYTQQYKELKQEIDFLKQRLPEKIEPLTTFNEASLIELSSKLRLAISANKANNIAPLIVEQRPFESLKEISQKVEGFGTTALLKIVDRWLYSQ